MPSLRAKPPAPLLDVPAVEIVPLVHPPSPVELAASPLRKVDVEQIAQVEGFAPPLASDGDYASGTNFAARAHAMQIAIPPLELTEADTAVLMAEAPVEMTVRLGSEALGSVSFRMSEQHGIDVQLSGLLDLVSDRFEPDEFARLRASSTADSFVPIEQLRAAGLNLSYDPVYDELQLSG